MKKYRISDFILDSLKAALQHLLFYAVGFVAFAMTAGHMMMNEHADRSAKHSSLVFYSLAMTVIYIAFICTRTRRNVGRKTRLIESSRDDSFDYRQYFWENVRRKILPMLAGGLLALLPYALFYTFYGWDYMYPSLFDRLYASSMICLSPLGGILGWITYNLIIVLAYAVNLYRVEKQELEDRMWIKEAPKQEFVDHSNHKYKYKDH